MAGNSAPEGFGDDFFEQILAVQPPGYGGGGGEVVGSTTLPMMGLQLGSSSISRLGLRSINNSSNNNNNNNNNNNMGMMPLGLNLEHHEFLRQQQEDGTTSLDTNNTNIISNNASASSSVAPGINVGRDTVHMTGLFPTFGQLQIHPTIRPTPPPPPHQIQQFNSQSTPGAGSAVPQPHTIRPRVRARRGQATDPHSIAERLRRVRITERVKALQELVPTCNKTDRAAMLDEVVDYVKFLRLQVKVLSMSRLGAAGAVAQLVADAPLSSIQGEGSEGGGNQQAWKNWSNDETEQEVAKLMEEDVGAAMQFLQSKALCIMPVSLASAIFQARPLHAPSLVKPESNNPS